MSALEWVTVRVTVYDIFTLVILHRQVWLSNPLPPGSNWKTFHFYIVVQCKSLCTLNSKIMAPTKCLKWGFTDVPLSINKRQSKLRSLGARRWALHNLRLNAKVCAPLHQNDDTNRIFNARFSEMVRHKKKNNSINYYSIKNLECHIC